MPDPDTQRPRTRALLESLHDAGWTVVVHPAWDPDDPEAGPEPEPFVVLPGEELP